MAPPSQELEPPANPERFTKDILSALAQTLNANQAGANYVEARATESQVKRLSGAGKLKEARYIAFVTHGLLPAETQKFSGIEEASLVFEPPSSPSEIDDGLLTTHEIAQMAIGAGLVLLVACNSGSADKTGIEAFSGLALSFLTAGAKAVLVSYYPINLDATVYLVRRFADHLRDRGSTPQVALRGAVKDTRDVFSHPHFWGGFAILSAQ